jgi:PAS domain S-box-containing protein
VQPPTASNGEAAEALDRLVRLQALTADLSQAATSEQVAEAILSQGLAVLGANAGCVTLLSDDHQELSLLRIAGAAPEVATTWQRFPLAAPVPLAEATRERTAVVLETFAERSARYPALGGFSPDEKGAMVALPMVVRGEVLGSLGWGWPADRPFTAEDRAFLLTLAGLCGQALDRARLYDRERAAHERAERAEASLRESEGRLRAIIDNWPSAIFVKDPRGRYLLANKACETYAGEPAERIVGKTDHDYLPAEVADRFRADDRRVLQTGEVLRYEEEAPLRGEPRTSLTVKFPLRDPGGRPYAVCGIATDITELKQAAEALRTSEERFARFMQALPGLAWIKDVRGRYAYANDAAVRAFRTPRAGLYGKTDEEVFPPATAAQFKENDRKALAGGAAVQVVETLEHPDGVLHHSLVSKFPIPGPGGEPAVVGGMAIDITEHMRTRAVLEESEERFRATFDQAAVGIAHVGLDGRWLRVNRKLCDIVGYGPQELMGLTFQDITHPDDLEADLAHVRRLLAGEIQTFSMQKRYFRKDRSLVWIELTVSLVRTPGGEAKYFISVVEDVTDEKQVQDALRRSEERLRTLSDNLPQGAVYQVLGDPEGRRRFTYISGGVERLFGVTPAEVLADAAALYGLVHEDDRPRLAAAEEVALRDRAPFDCEFRSRTRSGGLVWVQARSAPRRLPNGETAWEGLVVDVTARKRAEEALREADRRKDEFLATLAHELRNPLAPLRNALHVLKLTGGNPRVAEEARAVMERQLAQMVRLIDDLLDVSRITRGKLRLRRERVELASIVQSAVEGSRPLIEASGHRLTVVLPPEPLLLDADPTRLAQVFGNLLTNAAKYTDRGGRIGLTAERKGHEVVVAVRDTGIGIAAEHLPRLFEMFSQVAPALERSQGGLGIGLSLARGLVELHGGGIEARSEGLGKGSEFVVRLPLAVRSPNEGQQGAGADEGPCVPGCRILVADDSRDAADSLAMMLRLAGHEVHAVHDGQEAVEAAGWFRPDVALLDIGMPRLNGLQAARHIRGQPWGKKILLVAITGWGQEEDKRRATEAGFDHHLTKPVDPAALEEVLSRWKGTGGG